MKTRYHPFHYIAEILRLASLPNQPRSLWSELVLLFHADSKGNELYRLKDETRVRILNLIENHQTVDNQSTMALIKQNLAQM